MSSRVSIVINNYNYGRFLRSAIDSALAQTTAAEVIVVDDGSTDDSREVIRSYGDRITPILKSNGGQASALNAGFIASHGDVVIFLDADDVLLPTAAEVAEAALHDAPDASKAHWQMQAMLEDGTLTGNLHPPSPLQQGSHLKEIIAEGPWMCANPPTSGNAWSRAFLNRIFPIPEREHRICADAYMLALAPCLGRFVRIDAPQSCYRLHTANNYWNKSFDQTVARSVEVYESQCEVAARYLRSVGIDVNVEKWLGQSWWHMLKRSVDDIRSCVPEGQPFVLVDEDVWGTDGRVGGRPRHYFTAWDHEFGGPPADDEDAIAHLERHRASGIGFLVIAWPAFWYLRKYPAFRRKLKTTARRVLRNNRVMIYDLQHA
jgi:glycosyltransferase involved in cell wall biosynthesis